MPDDRFPAKDAIGVDHDILTDTITTRNGQAVTPVEAEVVKIATGGDGVAADVSASNPLPVSDQAIAAVLAELTQKLEPSDLAALATAARQDAATTVLDAIAAALAGTLKVGAAVTAPASVRLSDGAAAVGVTGGRLNVDVGTIALDGTVDVGNFPATQPVSASALPLPTGAATAAAQGTGNAALDAILAKLSGDPATQTTLAAVLSKLSSDPATQTTLAAVLSKLSSDPATAANQTTQVTRLDTLHADSGALLAKLSSDPATQATLAAVLAKLSGDPATATSQATQVTRLDTLHTDSAAILAKLTSDPATQATLAAVLAKLSADPATQATLAAVLAKLSGDPATATNQGTQVTRLDTLHTDSAAILAKLTSDPATQATLAAVLSKLSSDPATQTTLAAVLAQLIAGVATVPSTAGDVAGTLLQGRKSNSTPGTAVPLAAAGTGVPCKWVTVQSVPNNDNWVQVGASGVIAAVGLSPAVGLSTGVALNIGGSITIPTNNVNKVYLDVRTSGDAVTWLAGI